MTDHVVDILIVCTGNIARSPLAEVLLQEEARRRLGPEAPVWAHSVGVHGLDGRPAVNEMQQEAVSRGADLSRHRGARVRPDDLRDADLVITMTEDHRRQLLRSVPAAEERVFTLKELARLLSVVDEPDDPPAEPPDDRSVAERVRGLAQRAHRARPRAPQAAGPEDVRDPYGGSRAGYQEVAAEIDGLVSEVAEVLFGRGAGTGRDGDGQR